ncbi:MAG: LamG-like jellyroll fold domain-containing protein, partial [Verrucomicrobiota bacterium]
TSPNASIPDSGPNGYNATWIDDTTSAADLATGSLPPAEGEFLQCTGNAFIAAPPAAAVWDREPRTIEFWIRNRTPKAAAMPINWGNFRISVTNDDQRKMPDGKIRTIAHIYVNDQGLAGDIVDWDDCGWHHVAVSCDPVEGIHGWVDGVHSGSTVPEGFVSSAGDPPRIGYGANGIEGFEATFDLADVRVWLKSRVPSGDADLVNRFQRRLGSADFENLHAYWQLTETPSNLGDSVPESGPNGFHGTWTDGGVATDSADADAADDATEAGTVILTPEELENHHLQFKDNFIVTADPSAGVAMPGDCTIECWVKVSKANSMITLVAWVGGDNDWRYFGLRGNQSQGGKNPPAVFCSMGAQGVFEGRIEPSDWTPGSWMLLSVVIRNGELTNAYINGGQSIPISRKSKICPAGGSQFCLGYGACVGAPPGSNVSMTELRMWNTALDQSTIQQGKGARITGSEPNIQSYWPLTETPAAAGVGVLWISPKGRYKGIWTTPPSWKQQRWKKSQTQSRAVVEPDIDALTLDAEHYLDLPSGVGIYGQNPEFTLEFRFRDDPRGPARFCPIIKWGAAPQAFSLLMSEGDLVLGSEKIYEDAAGKPQLGWRQFSVVFSEGPCQVFLNGEQTGEFDLNLDLQGTPETEIAGIGGPSYGTALLTKKYEVTEMRIWDHARTADQIRTNLETPLYQNPLPDGVHAYWALETTPTEVDQVLLDLGPNGFDATWKEADS